MGSFLSIFSNAILILIIHYETILPLRFFFCIFLYHYFCIITLYNDFQSLAVATKSFMLHFETIF